MSTKNFFITGATGFIGGTVLDRFLRHESASSWQFTALVRSEEKAKKLRDFGVKTIIGSLSDLSLIENAASESDVVIAAADSDDLEGTQATLRGLKKRFQTTGKTPILINTSGTGVLSVLSEGLEATEEVYDDMNPDQIEGLPITQIHRDVDLAIVEADKEGYVKSYIVIPSTIYGLAKTRFVDAGIQNRHSVQIPTLIGASIARGQGGMVGLGKNFWPNVEIHELAELYVILYDAIVKGDNKALGHGREGYYFGESGEYLMYDVAKTIASALVKLGRGESEEPTTFTKEELDKYLGGSSYLGSNSRCVSNRSRALGWRPKRTTKDFLESVLPEVESMLKDGYVGNATLLGRVL